MTYRLTRTSTVPATALRILVDAQDPDAPDDAGFTAGGSFYWDPGDTFQVSEQAARAIMTDPGLAVHFTCDPPFVGDGAQ